MLDCSLNVFENNNIHPIDELLTENFFGEDLPSPESAPSYVTTYIEDTKSSIPEMIKNLGVKMLEIGKDFTRYVNSFENLRFELKTPDSFTTSYSEITGLVSQEDVILLVGDKEGKREVVGALPMSNPKYPNTSQLIQTIKEKINRGLPTIVNRPKLIKLISNAYDGRLQKSNPLSLSKHDLSKTTQSIADLKELYGKSYPFIFSSPYIVTGRLNLKENYSGRTVILYNKFPDSKETVDSFISKYGYNRALKDNMFGLIPLNNDVYTNLDDMLGDIEKYSGQELDGITQGGKFFLSGPSLVQFGDILQSLNLSGEAGTMISANITDLFNRSVVFSQDGSKTITTQSLDPLNFIKYLQEIRQLPFYSYLNSILKLNIEKDKDKVGGFRGLFVNPLLVKNNTDFKSGLARVDNSYPEAVTNRLLIVGLSPNVVQPQRMEFLMTDTTQDISDLFSTTFNPVVSNAEVTNRFNYTVKSPKYIGKEIHPSTSKLLEKFESRGIYDPDIRLWVKNITSEVLLNADSSNFTESLIEILDRLTKDYRDCI